MEEGAERRPESADGEESWEGLTSGGELFHTSTHSGHGDWYKTCSRSSQSEF